MSSYPCYKKTNEAWVTHVPEHWPMLSGKRLFKNNRTKAQNDDEQLAASQVYGVIPQVLMMKRNDAKVMLALKGTESFRHVDTDDFVISLRSFEGGVEHSKYTGCVSPAYTVLKPETHCKPEYYRHLLKSKGYISALQSTTDSLRDGKSISYDQFGSITLPCPPINEQVKIAKFLDYETAKLDALIDEQKRLIELLKEKRQAVISHAVTKGLNPDAQMKDSGVEWLGEVPVDWSVTKLKNYCSALPGFAFSSKDFTQDIAEQKLLRGINVGVGSIRWNETVYLNTTLTQRTREYQLAEGDIVIGLDRPWIGDGLRISRVNAVDLPALLVQRVASLKPSNLLLHNYLYLTLKSSAFKSYIEPDLTGVSVPHLSTDQILNYTFALPPLDEQKRLCEHVESVLELTDNLIHESSRLESTLIERRSALISAAVTGKIDVRDWQPPQGSDTVEKKESAQTEMQHG